MEFGRAFAFIFEDKNWVSKLLPLLLLGFLSLIPLAGLAATALALGYLLHLARNVRQGLPRPLPDWSKWREKLNDGSQLLLAMFLYNLPTILVFGCAYTLIVGIGSGFLGSSSSILTICCTLPIMILYSVVSWSMLSIGAAEYLETNNTRKFFRIGHQWDVLQTHYTVVFNWAVMATIVNIIFGLIVAIPCIGFFPYFLFLFPIQGHLLGQFAHRLSVVSKPKRDSTIRATD